MTTAGKVDLLAGTALVNETIPYTLRTGVHPGDKR